MAIQRYASGSYEAAKSVYQKVGSPSEPEQLAGIFEKPQVRQAIKEEASRTGVSTEEITATLRGGEFFGRGATYGGGGTGSNVVQTGVTKTGVPKYSPAPKPQTTYYRTSTGGITYRTDGKAPTGSREITQREFTQLKEAAQRGEDISRQAGQTETGGTYNIPGTASYNPGFLSQLGKPTGEETAGDIVRQYRRQETYDPVKGKVSPEASAMGFIASSVAYERERKKVPTLATQFEESLFERQGKKAKISKEGVLTVEEEGDKKIVVSPYGDYAIIPTSATFRPEFRGQLGTGVMFKDQVIGGIKDGTSSISSFFGLATVDSTLGPSDKRSSIVNKEMQKARFFEEYAKDIETRELQFKSSQAFGKLSILGSIISKGYGAPLENRSWGGQLAETLTTGFLAAPLAVYGGVRFGSEKLYFAGLSAAARVTTKTALTTEAIRPFKTEEFKETFDPTKPTGAATYIFAGLGAGFSMLGKTSKATRVLKKAAGKSQDVVIYDYPALKSESMVQRSPSTIKTKAGEVLETKYGYRSAVYELQKPTKGVKVIQGIEKVTRLTPEQYAAKEISAGRLGRVTYVSPTSEVLTVSQGRQAWGAYYYSRTGIVGKPSSVGGLKQTPEIFISKTLPTTKLKGFIKGEPTRSQVLRHELEHYRDVYYLGKTSEISAMVVENKPFIKVEPTKIKREGFFGVQTQTGVQYTTQVITQGKAKFYIRTKVTPKGERTTKIFKGDKPLSTIKDIAKPDIKFTEARPILENKNIISMDEFLSESGKKAYIQEGVSLVKQKFFKQTTKPIGRGLVEAKETLTVETVAPRETTVLGKPFEIDVVTGDVTPSSIYKEIGKTKYRFVDYPPKAKPYSFKNLPKEIIEEKPAKAITRQAIIRSGKYEITYETQPSRLGQDLVNLALDRYGSFFLLRTKKTQLVQRPSTPITEGTEFSYYGTLPKKGYSKTPIMTIGKPRGDQPKTITPTTEIETTKTGRKLNIIPINKNIIKTNLRGGIKAKVEEIVEPKSLNKVSSINIGATKNINISKVRTKERTKELLKQLQKTKQATKRPMGARARPSDIYNYIGRPPVTPPFILLPKLDLKEGKKKKKKKKLPYSRLYKPDLPALGEMQFGEGISPQSTQILAPTMRRLIYI